MMSRGDRLLHLMLASTSLLNPILLSDDLLLPTRVPVREQLLQNRQLERVLRLRVEMAKRAAATRSSRTSHAVEFDGAHEPAEGETQGELATG